MPLNEKKGVYIKRIREVALAASDHGTCSGRTCLSDMHAPFSLHGKVIFDLKMLCGYYVLQKTYRKW